MSDGNDLNPHAVELGSLIRRYRGFHGWTQHVLAAATGIHPVAVTNHETGKRLPNLPTMARYVHALHMDPAEVFRLWEAAPGSVEYQLTKNNPADV